MRSINYGLPSRPRLIFPSVLKGCTPQAVMQNYPFMSEAPPRLLYCRCAYAQVLPQEVKDGILRHLCASDRSFESVADLCEMSARRDPRLATLAADPLKIIACHPRAVKWLFHAAGAPLPDETEIINLRALTTEEAIAQLAQSPAAHIS